MASHFKTETPETELQVLNHLSSELTTAKAQKDRKHWSKTKDELYSHVKDLSRSDAMRRRCLVQLARHYNDGPKRTLCNIFAEGLPTHFNWAMNYYYRECRTRNTYGFFDIQDSDINKYFSGFPKARKRLEEVLSDIKGLSDGSSDDEDYTGLMMENNNSLTM